MKFKTVAEAFNHYRNFTNEQLEQRAGEINQQIETDAGVDIQAFNIELTGIAEAKRNNEQKAETAESRSAKPENRAAFALIGGRDTASRSFDADSVVDSEEYRSAFFKSLLGRELSETEERAFKAAQSVAEKRADAFNTSTNTVAVLPTATLNEVVTKARTIGGLLSECRQFSVPTKISIPVGTPSTRASWHTEGDEVETEKVTVSSVKFDGYEIIKVFSISAKTQRMSIGAFESYLTEELTACVMETIADALINGQGADAEQGTGLETGVTWVDSGANQNAVHLVTDGIFSYDEVVSTVALLKRGYAQGAKWAMNNRTLYQHFYRMRDSNNRPLFIDDPKSESIGKILGFEVVIDDNIADDVAYLGNYKKYLGYNLPEGIVVETSRESSFKKGLIDYRALAIADTKPIVPEAFVKLYRTPSQAGGGSSSGGGDSGSSGDSSGGGT